MTQAHQKQELELHVAPAVKVLGVAIVAGVGHTPLCSGIVILSTYCCEIWCQSNWASIPFGVGPSAAK